MYSTFFKRFIDLIFSFVLVIILIVPMVFVAILIKLESKGPIFFKQSRVGKNFKNFKILKFRTMTHEHRVVGSQPIIGKADGVTKIGYYLRRFKIDELPQLLHVLFGQMSLVGPRPSVPEQLMQMTEYEKRRYNVKPGLTGLAQISGNIHLPWKERYKLDIVYTENISFINDIRILFRTVLIIIKGEEKFVNKPLKMDKR